MHPIDNIASLGYWIRRRRKVLDLTQEQLAQQVGCAVDTIKKIEADARRPSRPMAERIADCLQIPDEERVTFLRVARAEVALHRAPLTVSSLVAVPSSKSEQPAHNLPVPANRLIGRGKEVREVQALLQRADVRLVTLTGAGGIGKTRLALQVAHELQARTAADCWFVSLAPVNQANLVMPTIAQTLGVSESAHQSSLDRVKHYLQQRQVLLLLDNFEHVLDAAAQLSELLAFAPGLKILVTSRAVLHLAGEYEYSVPPLALPDKVDLTDLAALVQCESVQLLLERAQARGANLSLAPDNVVAVANICLRLEGLPLALELAAARCKVFAPAELLAHLDHRLAFLTSGARDQPRRQQTLRATLDWSYQLLTEDEQILFARLGVFVGGFTLEAAEFVCTEAGAAHLQVVDGLAALLDQSLIRQMDETAGERRFLMLETIREYAREQLAGRGEEALLCDRHAAYFLALAEKSQPLLFGVQQQMWLQRLTLEISNFRAAVHWWRANGDYGQVARLGAVLCWLWIKHGNLREGAEWTEWALAEMKRGNTLPNAIRANALHAAAVSADWLGDLVHARALYEEYLQVEQAPDAFFDYYDVLDSFASNLLYAGDLQRALTLHERALAWAQQFADPMGIPNSLSEIGSLLHLQGEYERAKAVLQNALALRKAAGASMGIASAKGKLAIVLLEYSEVAQAQRLLEEALELVTALHDQQLLGNLLSTLGVVAQLQHEYQKAYQYQHASVVLFEQLGFQVYHALALVRLGNLMLLQAEIEPAHTYYRESLALAQKIGYQIGSLFVLEGLAGVAALRGQATAAAQMLGAAHAYRQKIGLVRSVDERILSERTLAVVRDVLDEAQFDAAFSKGRAIALDDALPHE